MRIQFDRKVEWALSLFKKTDYFGYVAKLGEVDLTGLSQKETGPRKQDKGLILILNSLARSLPTENDLPMNMLPAIHEIEVRTGIPFLYLWEGQRDGYHPKVFRRIDQASYLELIPSIG